MPTVDTTYGALLIGLIVGSVLYGATLLQTFFYYRAYPKDPIATKALVAVVWIFDTAQLILCTMALYWYLITNYRNDEALGKATWSLSLQTDCNGLIGLIVECFFARRVWILSKNIVVVLLIVILAFVHFGLGVVFTVEELIFVETSEFSKLIWVTSTGLGSAAAADVLIAVSLCYYLLKGRSGLHSTTDSLINTLIAYSLTTGLITSILAFICVVTFATMPTNYVWLAFFWVMGKCYVNSLLASLNNRDSLRARIRQRDATLIEMPDTPISPRGESHRRFSKLKIADGGRPSGDPINGIAVNVQMQTYYRSDAVFDGSEMTSPARPGAPGRV